MSDGCQTIGRSVNLWKLIPYTLEAFLAWEYLVVLGTQKMFLESLQKRRTINIFCQNAVVVRKYLTTVQEAYTIR